MLSVMAKPWNMEGTNNVLVELVEVSPLLYSLAHIVVYTTRCLPFKYFLGTLEAYGQSGHET